ncbi:MAG: hypothetical protein QXJ16_01930, partial [Desulfurococcaceae archaeon]
QEVTGSPMTTTATGVRLVELPRGGYLSRIYIKTGVRATGTTAGNNAYSTLSNSILTNIRVYRGLNNPVRYYANFQQAQFDAALGVSLSLPPTGIAVIDFVRNGLLGEAFDARPLVAGPSGSVDFYLEADVTGASNQGAVIMYEEIRSLPLVRTR